MIHTIYTINGLTEIARREMKGFKEGKNLRDSISLLKQLNNMRYDWSMLISSYCTFVYSM